MTTFSFPAPPEDLPLRPGEDTVVLAGGCFWCVEAVFLALEGVLSVRSGYAGGDRDSANYEAVCAGQTGHAEVIEVRYDTQRLTLGEILRIFFAVAHDPTQLNRQGNDRGTQYRSAIFYRDASQRKIAQAYIDRINEAGVFAQPVMTTLEPLDAFYVAEDYHQGYASRHPWQPYIMAVAAPKVEKLAVCFPQRLRKGDEV